ncbi:MAG: ribonuclease domain-containing protein [Eubacterium sp.]|nr:ribonuclease domain-containing protein [Eubacterium sp.]
MKKRIHIILAAMLIMILALTGCSNVTGSGAGSSASSQTTAQASTGYSEEADSAGSTAESTAESTIAEENSESATDRSSASSPDSVTATSTAEYESNEDADDSASIDEDGSYTSKDEVALYIHTYGHLPSNYITKRDAEDLGWNSKEGNLWDVADGMSIGGSKFGNYEGLLPEKSGRKYYECDIDYDGGYRGAKRIIYSNDGLIFYTEDHYKTFEQLY